MELFAEKNCLIVDHHPPVRQFIREQLKELNFANIYDLRFGKDIAGFIEEKEIHLLIVDVYLETAAGFALIKSLSEDRKHKKVKVLAISGANTQSDIVKAIDFGVKDYLVKPFTSSDLTRKLRSLFDKTDDMKNRENFYLTIDSLEASGDFEKAMALLAMKKSVYNDEPRFLYKIATLLKELGDLKKATSILEQNAKSYPLYYKTYAKLSDYYLEAGDKDKARFYIAEELSLHPRNYKRQIHRGMLLFNSSEYKLALSAFKVALHERPKDKKALNAIAKTYENMGLFEKSLYYYKRLRRHYPEFESPLKSVISLCRGFKKLRVARYFLIDELGKSKDCPLIYLLLSKVNEELQLYKEATKALEAGLVLFPSDSELAGALSALQTRILTFQKAS